jgi:hypothetical protein
MPEQKEILFEQDTAQQDVESYEFEPIKGYEMLK